MASKTQKNRGLGRGLSALMADVGSAENSNETSEEPRLDRMVPVEKIIANPDQPRKRFDDGDLQDLARSIKEKGVIQPLIVRPDPEKDGYFQIVAGERRWRASQIAQLHELPVLVREYDDTQVLEVAIIENIQRADLNPIEEALGYRQLLDRFGHTQELLATALGKSRSHIANLMRLLQLPEDVQALLEQGSLSAGHARALITAKDPSALAQLVVKQSLSVRETEKLAKGDKAKPVSKSRATSSEKDADTRALESDLSAALGMKVLLDHAAGGEAGTLQISYKSLDELDELCRLLSAGGNENVFAD